MTKSSSFLARSSINDLVVAATPGEFNPIQIGDLSIWPPVVLAPMAGVTDVPFRQLCRSSMIDGFTSKPSSIPGLFVNQMVTARALLEGHSKTLKLAEFAPNETPRSIQLYGTDPTILAEAVKKLVDDEHVDHIDMNFGCPVPKVTRHGGGGVLPYRRLLFRRIVAAAVKSARGRIPITVKFRIGIDNKNPTHLDAGKIAEEEGAAAVALHARTVEQLYSGKANWETIAELKEHVTTIPVLGNGDIWEAPDALRMLRVTGADGVVIGRGCLGRPWLFTDLALAFNGNEVNPLPTMAQVADTMRKQAELLVNWQGSEDALRKFRKHAIWYLTGMPVGRQARGRLQSVSSLAGLNSVLADIDPTIRLPIEALRVPRSHKSGPRPVTLPDGWLEDPNSELGLTEHAESLVSGG